METMNVRELRELLSACADRIIRNEPWLTRTDSAIGDGDHGIGMKNGMLAAKAYLEGDGAREENVYALLLGTADAMRRAMGGASGMIFSTLFAGRADEKKSATDMSPGEFAVHMKDGLEAIQTLGGAKVGDKTMVDALAPAVDAMMKNCTSFEQMFTAAEAAARKGMEDTAKYPARFGRAKSLMERSIGHRDAGASSTWLIFAEMLSRVGGKEIADPKLEDEKKPEAQGEELPWKKKLINRPEDCVREEGEGFLAAFGRDIAAVPGVNGLVRKNIPAGKTALVIGGGSGHEPMFGFFLGERLADAAANGNVFASPDPETIRRTALAAERGGGVLFVYGNYAGDNLNFDRAAQELEARGIEVRTVRVWDDIASAPRERIDERRGIAGDVLMLKIAGAACAELGLDEAYRVTKKARDNLWSIGVGLEGATIPGQKEPIFTLPGGEMEYGLGIHGEPGIRRVRMQSADAIAEELVGAILRESGVGAGDTVCTYVNGLGSTTLMELMILNRKLSLLLRDAGIKVHDMDVNSLVTTMEMAGASISIMKMDGELLKYYDMPCSSPYYTKL